MDKNQMKIDILETKIQVMEQTYQSEIKSVKLL